MRLSNNPETLRISGAGLLVAGALAFIGLRSLFLDYWMTFVMFGLTGWIAGAAYVAMVVCLVGAVLLLASFVRRRRPAV